MEERRWTVGKISCLIQDEKAEGDIELKRLRETIIKSV
jgi:hypothetical protein